MIERQFTLRFSLKMQRNKHAGVIYGELERFAYSSESGRPVQGIPARPSERSDAILSFLL
ncbi:MAG: hypothetical protein CSA33_00685 [Desulfobulbus propionicus]|nr:MAG: hypothetical protein CSA33_00685 [Desulfobulbus propionicus]